MEIPPFLSVAEARRPPRGQGLAAEDPGGHSHGTGGAEGFTKMVG
jgi:hypothetical protein